MGTRLVTNKASGDGRGFKYLPVSVCRPRLNLYPANPMARTGGWYGIAVKIAEIVGYVEVLLSSIPMVSWHYVTHLAYRLPIAEGGSRLDRE